MNIPTGTSRGLTAPSSSTVCFYMLLGRDGKKWRDSSAEATSKAYPDQILKKASPPYGWWAIRPPGKKSGTYTMRYTLLRRSPRPTTMWASAERGSYSGHLVLTDELVVKVGVLSLQKEDQYGVAAATYQPFSQSEGWSLVSWEEKPTWRGPPGG